MRTAKVIPLSEADWQSRVIDLAKHHKWMVFHPRPARTAGGWRTAFIGDPGFPDLVLARGGMVLCVELKSDTGKLRPEQVAWQDANGAHARVWRPRDWEAVRAELAPTKPYGDPS